MLSFIRIAFMDRSLTISSDPSEIERVEEFLAEVSTAAGLSEDLAGDLIIAGTEAVNNAIQHGGRPQAEQQVRIRARLLCDKGPSRLELRVSDAGRDFDPGGVADPTTPEGLLNETGRGLLIIRHLMDELRFEQGPEGMTVVMVKVIGEDQRST